MSVRVTAMKTMIISNVLYLAIDDCPKVRSEKESR